MLFNLSLSISFILSLSKDGHRSRFDELTTSGSGKP